MQVPVGLLGVLLSHLCVCVCVCLCVSVCVRVCACVFARAFVRARREALNRDSLVDMRVSCQLVRPLYVCEGMCVSVQNTYSLVLPARPPMHELAVGTNAHSH